MIIAISYVVGVLTGTVAGAISRSGVHAFANEMLRWVFLISVGVPLLIAFVGHTFNGEVAAKRLGWPAGNPFQTELGIWDGGRRRDRRARVLASRQLLAAVILHALSWTGAGIVHVRDIIRNQNRHADNALPAIVNFLVPMTIITLYILAQ